MIQTFENICTSWLKRTGLLQTARCFSGFSYRLSEAIPEPLQVKRSFLIAIVPSGFRRVFSNHSFHLDYLIRNLFSFGSYLTEAKLKNRMEAGILSQLSFSQKESACNQLIAFLTCQNHWTNGSWHNLLTEDPISGFDTVCTKLRFADPWTCARFLASCGYLIPYSEYAAKGFQYWSGRQPTASDFVDWRQRLDSLHQNKEEAFKQDRFLDCLFNPKQSVLQKPLCMDRTSCEDCPLAESCYLINYSIGLNDTANAKIQIKTGDLKHITTRDLLLFLADQNWFATVRQKQLTTEFPRVFQTGFSELSSPAEEDLLCKYLAIKELAKRIHEPEAEVIGKPFTNAGEIYKHFKSELSRDTQESFFTLILDNKHRIISKKLITLGTLNQSLVHPREVFAAAIQLRAAAVILVHNHPSGDPTPSSQDISITQRLQDVGDIVGINVLDHVIIGSEGFFSFVDENLMDA